MFGIIPLPTITIGRFSSFANRVQKGGLMGALLLGAFFALAFYPTSAALFFGSLLPMSIEQKSPFLLPFIFGSSTSLPVVIFALLISLGVNKIGTLFNRLSSFERYCRMLTGIIFLVVGILMSLQI